METEHMETSEQPHVSFSMFMLGIIAMSANLRPAITAVGPLIGNIQQQLHLSSGLVAFTTTLPLLSFALFSPYVHRIVQRWGHERTLAASAIVLIVGMVIRLIPTVYALFIGTTITGVGIAIGNVTLPGFIKDRYPERIGLLTGIYSLSLTLFAATASGISLPLAHFFDSGWRGALAFWLIPAFLGLLLWWPQLAAGNKRRQYQLQSASMSHEEKAMAINTSGSTMWRSPLAWHVTLFMGLQSFIYYVLVTWLPEMLQEKGVTHAMAGWLVSLAQYISLPATLFVPMLADRLTDQRRIVFVTCLMYAVGLATFLSDNTVWLIVGIACFGLGLGTCISLSLAFIGMRTNNVHEATYLSGMSQSVGYALAAIGPVLFGVIRDATGSWYIPNIMLVVLCCIMLMFGWGAGRNAKIRNP